MQVPCDIISPKQPLYKGERESKCIITRSPGVEEPGNPSEGQRFQGNKSRSHALPYNYTGSDVE
jgi:hypothetical protein